MMKRLAFVYLLTFVSIMSQAQVAELWVAMPDSLFPYLSQQQRFYMVQYSKQGVTDTVENNMRGESYIQTLDTEHNNYMRVQLTTHATWEFWSDSIFSIRTTICAPKCAAITRYYSPLWEYIGMLREPLQEEATEEEKQQHF